MTWDLPPKIWLPPKPAIVQPAPVQKANFLPGMFPGLMMAAGGGDTTDFPSVLTTNQGGTTGFTASTTFAVPLPADIEAGDELLIFVAVQNNTGATTVSTPSGWTELFNVVGGGNMRRFAVFTRTADGGEGSTVNVTASASSQWGTSSYRLSGVSGFEAATATGNSATADPPNLSPLGGASKILWLAAFSAANLAGTTAPTPPTDYTDQLVHTHDTFGQAVVQHASARRELEAASENPGTFALNGGSGQWIGVTVAIIP
jgi:hypothetical protein